MKEFGLGDAPLPLALARFALDLMSAPLWPLWLYTDLRRTER